MDTRKLLSIVFLCGALAYFVYRVVWILGYKKSVKQYDKKQSFEKSGAYLLIVSAVCAIAMAYIEVKMHEISKNIVNQSSSIIDYFTGKSVGSINDYYFTVIMFATALILFITFILEYVIGNSICITNDGVFGLESKVVKPSDCTYEIIVQEINKDDEDYDEESEKSADKDDKDADEKSSDDDDTATEKPKVFVKFYDKKGSLMEKINLRAREENVRPILEKFYTKRDESDSIPYDEDIDVEGELAEDAVEDENI